MNFVFTTAILFKFAFVPVCVESKLWISQLNILTYIYNIMAMIANKFKFSQIMKVIKRTVIFNILLLSCLDDLVTNAHFQEIIKEKTFINLCGPYSQFVWCTFFSLYVFYNFFSYLFTHWHHTAFVKSFFYTFRHQHL